MIFMNDFKAEPQILRDAMMEGVQRVINSGWYVLGSEVQKFEAEWARICGTTNAIGVGNGMDAIEIILRGLEIGPGDEVITTPMTAFASVLAIYRAGATPVLADIDPTTALMSIESARRCISGRTKAILLVHLYGQLCNIDLWQKFCDEYGISLVEDCAQAHLASIDEKCAGSFGVAAAFSFYPTKNLGAPGDAGIIVTGNSKLAEKAMRLRNYGQSIRYYHTDLGLNSRLDEIHAAILNERLKWLNDFKERRQFIAEKFRAGISNSEINLLAKPKSKASHVYHLFVLTCAYRRELQEHLENEGVQTLIHYPVPIHRQKPCLSIERDPLGLSASEKHSNDCLSLPCHPQMTDEDVKIIINAVNSFKVK